MSLAISASDMDGQAIEISTKFIEMPPFSLTVLTPSIGSTPAFVADQSGLYILRVTVTDETGRYGFSDVEILVAVAPP